MGQGNGCCGPESHKSTRQNVPKQVIEYFGKPILYPKFEPFPNPYCPKLYGQFHYESNPLKQVQLKLPVNPLQRTKYTWKEFPVWQYPLEKLKGLPNSAIKERTFIEKYEWFKGKLSKQKEKYGKGYNKLSVDPTNVLLSSYQGFNDINFNLETKIVFTDDKSAIDAGGLFREWVNMCIIQAFSPQLGMLKLCQTDQSAYKIVANKTNKTIFIEIAKILGFVIGKSMIEQISLDCNFNRPFFRMLANQPIHLNDIYNYDIQIYNSLKSILDHPISESDLIPFTCKINDQFTNKQSQIQLIPNGKQIYVNDNNKKQFVEKVIKFYCFQMIQPIFKSLKTSLYEVIPYKYLQIFEPSQLEMIVCGRQQINIINWMKYTCYKGYSSNDQIIGWFWEIVTNFDQKLKSNLLHFCTGSTKVPINGFKYLQCKRGKLKQFSIKKIEFNPHNPYPKGITCFNKLELPPYKSKSQLESMLLAVCQQQIHDFGLDNIGH